MNLTKEDRLTRVALAVFRLNGQLIEWGDLFSYRHGLTSARWQVLGAISLAPQPLSIPQIAAAMGVTRQGVLKQVNLLANEGLVQAQPNPMHKRSPLYTLTEKGRVTYQTLNERWKKHVHEVASGFNAADLEAALRVLTAMSQVYEQ